MMKAENVQLVIQSKTDKLNLVREFVSESAQSYGFDEETINKIALAVDEACTNVIKHSYEYAPNKEIAVRIVAENGDFAVVITHQGKSFHPEEIKSPDMREYFDHFRRGGLGIHLMRSLMDRVEYRNLPDNKNEVRLVKRIPAKGDRP